ncbi:Lipase (class 2) [Streptomyces sp. TLI_053]|uniref:esterase/lipase family protein n=1 Tax=Streptomyces sp. TLI_053 TaxID=1855352 RepID=UPI00087C4877|nr:lipase [Streptomyces sp. TLI_053]SDT82638.1 Lipase (class 2) [Streptomyces sp. TLI_053]
MRRTAQTVTPAAPTAPATSPTAVRSTVRTALVAASAAALLVAPVAVTPALAAPATTPVVLIHGRNADPGVWGTAIDVLLSKGYDRSRLFTWSYDTSLSTNETLADRLSAYVDQVLAQTGAAKVDIVAHSLGSLPSRWYVKFGNGSRTVKNWISLAGPNHGTGLAWLCAAWDQGCRDMTPGSYVVSHLNRTPETPAPVHYWTFWSPADEQITPASSTRLDGATNTEVPGLKHNDFLGNAAVLARVAAVLTGG